MNFFFALVLHLTLYIHIAMETNPEILLKKRKNADRLRVEKQEQARRRAEDRRIKKSSDLKNSKFLRAESIVAKRLASDREFERVERIERYERLHSEEVDSDADRLLLVVRIERSHMGKIPLKAKKVLDVLRLNKTHNATFLKLNAKVKPLLKLINPYVVVGTPSLATVRSLIQKRATVKLPLKEGEEARAPINPAGDESAEVEGKDYKIVALNDNNLIEENLGDYGVICTEDIIHEIYKTGDSFIECVKFMEPFHLKEPVSGWGSLSKLHRLERSEKTKSSRVSSKANAPLNEVDIDAYIAEQI